MSCTFAEIFSVFYIIFYGHDKTNFNLKDRKDKLKAE